MKMNFVRQMSKTSGMSMSENTSKKVFTNILIAVGFGRSDKDSEREKMLDPVNDGEEEFDEEGLDIVFRAFYCIYFFQKRGKQNQPRQVPL